MKNNFSKLAVRVVLFLLVLAAGWYFTKSSKGSAPVVKMGTVEVKVGETKCSAITDAGYKLTGSGYASTLDAKTEPT